MAHRIATIILAAAFLFAPVSAQAMWAKLSEAELIESSSLIATGTLVEFAQITDPADGQIRTVGVIEIRTVLKGDFVAKTVQLGVPQPGAPVSSSDLIYQAGQNGLWFLRLLTPDSGGIYAADHPQRFVPLDQAGPSIEAVRRSLER